MIAYCNTCEAWRSTSHTCYPLWEVRDTTDDGVGFRPDDPWSVAGEIRASDAEEAAERFAQVDDEYLARDDGHRLIVEVRSVANRSRVLRFECRAEHTVNYYAREVAVPDPTPSPSAQEAGAPTDPAQGEQL